MLSCKISVGCAALQLLFHAAIQHEEGSLMPSFYHCNHARTVRFITLILSVKFKFLQRNKFQCSSFYYL